MIIVLLESYGLGKTTIENELAIYRSFEKDYLIGRFSKI